MPADRETATFDYGVPAAEVMTTIRPEALVRWHRAGFRRYWPWKSRNLGGPATNRCGSAGIDPADLIDELDPKVFATSSITGIAGCCAGAVSGHAIAPPSSVMKSRGITAVAALTARAAGVRRHEMRTYQFVLVGRKAAAAQITRPISIRREDRHDAIRRIPRVRRRF
jgi:hypothetical protein